MLSESFSKAATQDRFFTPLRNADYDAVGTLLDQIRLQCKKQRIKLDQFFKVYDFHKTKKISRSQFERAIKNAGVQVPPSADLDSLLERYVVDPRTASDLIDYQKFLQEVEKVFAFKGLEKQPRNGQTLRIATADSERLPLGLRNTTFNPTKQRHLKTALDILVAVGGRYGVTLREGLEEFDAHSHGRVAENQFRRHMHSLSRQWSQNPAALDALVEAYTALRGEVNYRALEDDLIEMLRAGDWHWSSTKQLKGPTDVPQAAAWKEEVHWADQVGTMHTDNLERLLRLQVRQKRVALLEAFQPHDRLSRGVCTRGQFEKSLSLCFSAPFTQDQLDALAAKYRDGTMINYRKFIAALQRPRSAQPQGNRDTQISFSSPGYSNGRGRPATSGGEAAENQEEDLARDMIEKIRFLVNRDIPNIKDAFQDFDRTREGYVTRNQFLRVLSKMHLLDFHPDSPEALALIHYYTSNDLSHPSGNHVNYILFLKDVAPDSVKLGGMAALPLQSQNSQPIVPQQVRREVPPHHQESTWRSRDKNRRHRERWSLTGDVFLPERSAEPHIRTKHELKEELQAVLCGIQEYVQVNGRRPQEFFQDADPLRHGCISASQFQRGLVQMGIFLKPADLQILCKNYQDSNVTDSRQRPFVKYTSFVMDLGGAGPKVPGRSSTQQLSVTKSCPILQPVSSKGTLQYLKPSTLTPEEEAEFADVLNDIASEISVHRVHIQPNFEDFDPVRRGYITKATFGRALALAGIRFDDPRKFELICRKFQEPSQRTYQEVNYRSFLKAIEEVSEGCTPRQVSSASEFRKTLMDSHLSKSQRTIETATPFQASLKNSGWKNLSDSWSMLPKEQQHQQGDVQTQELKSVLYHIRSQIEESNVDFPDFFADADIRKRGVMPAQKFLTALQQFGLTLSASQMEILDAKYRLPGSHQDLINWRQFAAAVKATPLAQKVEMADRVQKETVLGKVKAHLVRRRVALDQMLADQDSHRIRQVPKEKLFHILRNCNIFLTSKEEDQIYQAFKVRKGVTDTDFINYRRLLEYLESDEL